MSREKRGILWHLLTPAAAKEQARMAEMAQQARGQVPYAESSVTMSPDQDEQIMAATLMYQMHQYAQKIEVEKAVRSQIQVPAPKAIPPRTDIEIIEPQKSTKVYKAPYSSKRK